MTPDTGRSPSPDTPLGRSNSQVQAFPLRPLTVAPSTGEPSRANAKSNFNLGEAANPTPTSRLQDTNTLSSFSRLQDTHGTELISGEATTKTTTVDETYTDIDTDDCRSEPTNELMTKDEPPLLRSTAGFSSPSYGAISPRPSNVGGTEEESPTGTMRSGTYTYTDTDASEAHSFARDFGTTSTTASRRRELSAARSLGRLSLRRSEEFGGSATAGGLEGRFGTETSLLNDLIEDDTKFGDHDEDGDYVSVVGDSDVDDDNDPPDNSPYAQVRASVAPTDNTTLSINTPRMWCLSVLFSVLGSSTNLFFSLRYPSVAITPVIALLLVHPLGLMWDFFLKRGDDPDEEYVDGCRSANASVHSPEPHQRPTIPWEQRGRLDRFRLWLAQGRWNEKEHSCVYVSSNVSFGFAFATDVIVEQTQFYKQEAPILYQLLLTLSTQILGYTFAGLTRRFLVRPSGMIWPGTLMSAAMFTTLHKEENKPANGWTISRWNFFYVVWLFSFVFYFLPGLLMPALSYFNVITWFAPDNVVVANLFGVVSGLGLFPMTFDWAQVTYIGSPLLTPFWAAMNVVGGLVVVMWVIAPIAYYGNWFYSSYMPILSAAVFDNTGNVYDVSKVLTGEFLFDREAYSKYSRVFLPITYVLSYGVQFAGLASLLTHTICWHGKDIWRQWKSSLEEASEEPKTDYEPVRDGADDNGQGSSGRSNGNGSRNTRPSLNRSTSSIDNLMSREDVHNRLMRRYKDAPMTWYLITFASMLAVGIYVVEA